MVSRRRVGMVLGFLTLPLALWATTALSDANLNTAPAKLTVADAVLGIINHTNWPNRPSREVLLCVQDSSEHVTALMGLPERQPKLTDKLHAVRLLESGADIPNDCDVVYLGNTPAAMSRLPRLVGRPVVSIGHGPDFCSRGGMFCLLQRPQGLRIEVNLDTVARSGLNVHPQVLRLGQPKTLPPVSGSSGSPP